MRRRQCRNTKIQLDNDTTPHCLMKKNNKNYYIKKKINNIKFQYYHKYQRKHLSELVLN